MRRLESGVVGGRHRLVELRSREVQRPSLARRQRFVDRVAHERV